MLPPLFLLYKGRWWRLPLNKTEIPYTRIITNVLTNTLIPQMMGITDVVNFKMMYWGLADGLFESMTSCRPI